MRSLMICSMLVSVLFHASAQNPSVEDYGLVLPDEIVIRFRSAEAASLLVSALEMPESAVLLESADAAESLPQPLPEGILGLRPFATDEALQEVFEETPSLSSLLDTEGPYTKRQQRRLANTLEGDMGEENVGPEGLFHADLAPGTDMGNILDALNGMEHVEYAEPSPLLELAQAPNDPLYPRMWNLRQINLGTAWTALPENPQEIKVCIIDTGVRLDHAELAGRIANPKDVYPANGDAYANSDPGDDDPHGHGTACAGIVASISDNANLISGIAPVTIIPVNGAILVDGDYLIANYVEGIYWAVDNGAKVISLSLGGHRARATRGELDAVKYAKDRGVIICAAAGNGDGNADTHFPSAIPYAVSVGAVDNDGRRVKKPRWWWGSNFGQSVDICAPGQGRVGPFMDSVLTLAPASASAFTNTFNGTSAATPHVAALCGLMYAVRPQLTAERVLEIVQTTAKDRVGEPSEDTQGRDNHHGFGLIDVDAAIAQAIL